MEKLKSIHLLTPEQLICLGSDAQREIVELLSEASPLSRTEIAVRLGRPPTSLHYQLRRLLEVGLVVGAGERPSGRRPEALYRLVADSLSSAAAAETASGRRALADAGLKIAVAAGRAAARAFGEGASLAGPQREAVVRRLSMTLDADGLARLNALIDTLTEQMSDLSRSNGQAFSVTIIQSRR